MNLVLGISKSTKWIEKVDQLAKINGWDDNTKVFHMQGRLVGLARKWYDNRPTYDLNWTEWKELLLKSFPEHQDYATAIRKMINRYKKANESWEEYYFDKLELINACEIINQERRVLSDRRNT